jgi:3-dehydroquinate synthase
MLKKIRVSLGDRSYPILIGHNALGQLGSVLRKQKITGSALVVTQKEIWSHWKFPIKETLSHQGYDFKLHMPSAKRSEEAKSFTHLVQVLKSASALDGRGKSIFLIALGGGVIGDLTGFAASIYRRGVPYIQIPTTLTAQVDSSIGGKTAVDLPQGKNLLGTIYQPQLVLADPLCLQSLSASYFQDGLAEVIKYAVIEDHHLLSFLEHNKSKIMNRDVTSLEYLIHACAKIKARIVSKDEWDKKGIRMALNFGHTIGHALEAALSYRGYTHGQAVGLGMLCALDISDASGILEDASLPRRIEGLLSDFGLPVTIKRQVQTKKVMHAMGFDKKKLRGKNRFVLIKGAGKTDIQEDVPEELVMQQINNRKN